MPHYPDHQTSPVMTLHFNLKTIRGSLRANGYGIAKGRVPASLKLKIDLSFTINSSPAQYCVSPVFILHKG
jgi:hypothetical protein